MLYFKMPMYANRRHTVRFENCKEGEELENYTKYALKPAQELAQLLAGADDLFVISCNKCFKEFESLQEPDLDASLTLAADLGKTVTGSIRLDFLCNKTQTAKALADSIPEGTKCIAVISCGLVCRPWLLW